jgi:hypothetical protein
MRHKSYVWKGFNTCKIPPIHKKIGVISLTLFGHERTKGRGLLYKVFFKCTRKFLQVCYGIGFRITLIFALCFQWINLIDGAHFLKCEVELSYHLLLSPLFWECHTMGLYPPLQSTCIPLTCRLAL